MAYTATISSKGQLAIPAHLHKEFKLKAGTKVRVEASNGVIMITPNPADPYDAMIALRGVMSHIEEDVEAWWSEEKRTEREREDQR